MTDRKEKEARSISLAAAFLPLSYLVFCGFGLQTLWAACLVRQQSINLATVDVHTVFYGFFGAFCLIIALFSIFRNQTADLTCLRHHIYDALALLAIAGSTYLLSSLSPVDKAVSGWVGAIIGALGSTWMLMRWGQTLSCLPIKKSVHCILLSYIFHFFGLALFGFLDSSLSIIFLLFLALGSFTTLKISLKTLGKIQAEQATVYYDRESISSFWQTLAAVTLYGFILGMRGEFSLTVSSPIASLICQIIAALTVVAIIVWIFGAKGSLGFSRLFQLLLIIIATGFFLYPFATGFQKDIVASLFIVGVGLIYMLMWLGLVDVARHSQLHPFVVIGIWGACYGLPRPLAILVTDFRPFASLSGSENYLALLSLMLVYGIVICTALLLGSQPHGQRPLLSSLSAPLPLPNLYGRIDERCHEIGKSNGLTSREIEVIQYIAKGRSKSYIADSLFLSENTVKSYAKKAYAKLDIHSKQELLDLLNIEK